MGVLGMLREILIAIAGAGAGFLVTRNLLEKKYARLVDEEIQRTEEFFKEEIRRTKKFFGADPEKSIDDQELTEQAIQTANALTEYSGGNFVSPAKLVDEVNASIRRDEERRHVAYNRPGAPSIVEDVVHDIESNVAAAPLDPDARNPYLITFAEFDGGELDHEKITVSFFAGDGIVADEQDSAISPDRVEQIIGTDNLNKFGTNTEDPDMELNTIYVRCERFNMDFEVTRSLGSYAVEVLGQTG